MKKLAIFLAILLLAPRLKAQSVTPGCNDLSVQSIMMDNDTANLMKVTIANSCSNCASGLAGCVYMQLEVIRTVAPFDTLASSNCWCLWSPNNNSQRTYGINASVTALPALSDIRVSFEANGCGCDSMSIGCAAPPAPTPNTPATSLRLCGEGSTTLSVHSPYTVHWFSSASASLAMATGLSFMTPTLGAGQHTFYAEALGCTNSASRTAVTVTVELLPGAPLDNTPLHDLSLCAGESATLQALSSHTVQWFGSAFSSSVEGTGTTFVTPPLPVGLYSFYAGAIGCGPSASRTAISVTVNPMPVVTAATNSSLLCTGQAATLTASGAAAFLWSSGATGASLVVSPSVSTTYTVSGSTAEGCVDTATLTQVVGDCAGLAGIAPPAAGPAVFPNPFYNKITVVTTGERSQLEVFNLVGEKVFGAMVHAPSLEVDLTGFSAGIYFVRLGGSCFKIVKAIP